MGCGPLEVGGEVVSIPLPIPPGTGTHPDCSGTGWAMIGRAVGPGLGLIPVTTGCGLLGGLGRRRRCPVPWHPSAATAAATRGYEG